MTRVTGLGLYRKWILLNDRAVRIPRKKKKKKKRNAEATKVPKPQAEGKWRQTHASWKNEQTGGMGHLALLFT